MKLYRRVLPMLLAVLLLMSASFAVFSSAADEEYTPVYTYVLSYNVDDDGYDGANLQYFSPYVSDYIFDNSPSYIQSNIFSMYNTITNEVIPTYCTDIKVGALPDNRYRRLNLEDSTYAANAAGLLRAIVWNGFYIIPIANETMEAHAVRVDEKLQELGAAVGIPDLTIGEAISGTQTAIWQAAHGTRLEFPDFVRTIYTTKMRSATKYYDICNEERENGHIDYTVSSYGQVNLAPESDAYLNSRIKAVYDYLLALEPMAPKAKSVSAASFLNIQSPVVTQNGDGTYDVSVTTTVDVDMAAGDTLTISAVLDKTHYVSTALSDGKQVVRMTIENVPANIANNELTLAIDGYQTALDAFLYDALGDRETAQTMIGIDDSRMPVHAEVIATNERVLHFYKTTQIENGRHPLEGITFDIYLAAELDDYRHGLVELPEPEDFVCPNISDFVVITDKNGYATVNFTQHGMPDGVYLVVERPHPAIKAPVDPFYVFVPTTNAAGNGYDYEITVQPKNDVKGSVRIEKDINFIGNNSSTVDAYSNHTWIIGTNVPEDIYTGKSFVISDTLDNRLDYVGNVKVNVETADGETVLYTLAADTDYKVTVDDVDSLAEGNPSDFFSVELTKTGMGNIAMNIGDNNIDDCMLRVYFDAQINANAEMAEEIPNQASLKYTNSVNFVFDVESDKPVVYTGAANLLKVDSQDNSEVLSGAVFELYRAATAEEVAEGEGLITLDGYVEPMVKVSFFNNAAMKGDKVTAVTSDDNGKVAIYGLAHGKYILVETQAPSGYNLMGETLELTIDGNSHTAEKVVVIENINGVVLPSTGGAGTKLFTVIGAVLMLASFVLFYAKKRAA